MDQKPAAHGLQVFHWLARKVSKEFKDSQVQLEQPDHKALKEFKVLLV
jgi:hypothetical protein